MLLNMLELLCRVSKVYIYLPKLLERSAGVLL